MHRMGVVHRDLHTYNVMLKVTENGNNIMITDIALIDFGAALTFTGTNVEEFTQAMEREVVVLTDLIDQLTHDY